MIISIIVIAITVVLVYLAHVIVAHVRMLIHVRCRAMDAFYVIADQTILAINAQVGLSISKHILGLWFFLLFNIISNPTLFPKCTLFINVFLHHFHHFIANKFASIAIPTNSNSNQTNIDIKSISTRTHTQNRG